MERRILYSALIIAATGSLALFILHRFHLAVGWWLGILIGLVNFSSLLSSLKKVQTPAKEKSTGKFQQVFFLRYLLLAGAFFLIIQLGKEQLGSAVLGFLSLYVALFIDYFFRFKKQ